MQNVIDRLLASRTERLNASLIAVGAMNAHGRLASRYLLLKLADPSRQRYRRSIRMALHQVRRERPRASGERLTSFFRVLGAREIPRV